MNFLETLIVFMPVTVAIVFLLFARTLLVKHDRVSMGNLTSMLKKSAKNAAGVGIVLGGSVLAALGGEARGEIITINTLRDLIPGVGSSSSQTWRMDYGSEGHLKIHDSVTGEDLAPEKDGGIWHVGAVKYVQGGLVFGAAASNDNDNSNNYEGFEGWCFGKVYSSVFGEGERLEDAVAVHDPDGIPMGFYDTWNDTLTFDDNITFYFTEDVEINGVQGDLNQFPAFTYSAINIIPPVVVNPKTGYDMGDLADFAYYWMSGCDESNGNCEGLDSNGDGFINYVDFADFASKWNPSESLSMGASVDKSLDSKYSEGNELETYSANQKDMGVYNVDSVEPNTSYKISTIEFGDKIITVHGEANSPTQYP